MLVQDLITRHPVTVSAADSVAKAAGQMKEHDVGSVVVVDDGEIVGMLTDRDIALRLNGSDRPDAVFVGAIMTRSPLCLRGDVDVEYCLKRMQEEAVRRVPILGDRGKLMGVVSLDDILLHLGRTLGSAAKLIYTEVAGVEWEAT